MCRTLRTAHGVCLLLFVGYAVAARIGRKGLASARLRISATKKKEPLTQIKESGPAKDSAADQAAAGQDSIKT